MTELEHAKVKIKMIIESLQDTQKTMDKMDIGTMVEMLIVLQKNIERI